MGKFACGPAPFRAHSSHGSPPTRSSTYVPGEKACMRSRAHFGTPFTPIVPPSCSTCNPSGQFCMPARANPFRHTSHADRARKGARPTAPVGKSACGAQSISAHPSRGSCTKGKSTYAPSVGFRQFRRTPHTAHTPKGVPPTASVGKLACVHVQILYTSHTDCALQAPRSRSGGPRSH